MSTPIERLADARRRAKYAPRERRSQITAEALLAWMAEDEAGWIVCCILDLVRHLEGEGRPVQPLGPRRDISAELVVEMERARRLPIDEHMGLVMAAERFLGEAPRRPPLVLLAPLVLDEQPKAA